MFFSQPVHLVKAEELKQEPPKGTAYSVAIAGTEQPGRSRIYRAWNAQKELLKTLDPQVYALLGICGTRSVSNANSIPGRDCP